MFVLHATGEFCTKYLGVNKLDLQLRWRVGYLRLEGRGRLMGRIAPDRQKATVAETCCIDLESRSMAGSQ